MLLGSCKSWTESTKSGSLKKGTKPSQCGQKKKKKWHWETENLLLTFNVPNLIHLVHYLFFIWAQVLRKPTHYCPGCFLVNSVSISWEIVLSFIMTNKGPEIITLNRKSHKDTSSNAQGTVTEVPEQNRRHAHGEGVWSCHSSSRSGWLSKGSWGHLCLFSGLAFCGTSEWTQPWCTSGISCCLCHLTGCMILDIPLALWASDFLNCKMGMRHLQLPPCVVVTIQWGHTGQVSGM